MRIVETDYAWAAGIVDGEGAILMTRAKAGVNRRVTESFQIRISVRMTHEPTIRKLHRLFGGTFKGAKSRDVERHKPAFEWYVGDLKTVVVLTKIGPYLVTKKAQSNLVLEYRARCSSGPLPGRGAKCSPEVVNLRARYFARLRILNRKGPTT